MTTETHKLCRDCRWCEYGNGLHAQCRAPQNIIRSLSLVTGAVEESHHYEYCLAHRHSPSRPEGDNCGSDASWFEPREIQDAAE